MLSHKVFIGNVMGLSACKPGQSVPFSTRGTGQTGLRVCETCSHTLLAVTGFGNTGVIQPELFAFLKGERKAGQHAVTYLDLMRQLKIEVLC